MAYAKEIMGGALPAVTAGAIGGQYSAITAAGSTITDAAVLTASMAMVASADGTKGVILTGQPGDEVWVFNNSGSTLKVYPPTSTSAIAVVGTGIGTVGAAFSQLTYKSAIYKCLTTTQWLVNVSA